MAHPGCHREEDWIILGSEPDQRFSNEDFLQVFRKRAAQGRHNPRCVIFSTCGGDRKDEGKVLPEALVNAAVGVKFVIHWLGPAPDKVAAHYSSLFVQCLSQEPMSLTPTERYHKSHLKALLQLPDKVTAEPEPGWSEKTLQYCIDSVKRIRCFPDPPPY